MKKLKIVAVSNKRSVNKEIEYVLEQYISDYEAKFGLITIPEEE